MIHPHSKVQYIGDPIGTGVFATQFIPCGTIVYVKDELEMSISPKAFAQLDPILQEAIEKYSYIENQGNRIVSWDHGKYVNHCCDCNTMSTGYGFEIAIRNILPSEEITGEYGLFNIIEDMPLICPKPNCRLQISPHDIDHYFEVWDQKVKSALVKILEVDQPLLPLLDIATMEKVVIFLSDQELYQSVQSLKLNLIK